MSNLLYTAAEATKVATVAPSSDSTVFTMQLNCWKPALAAVPGTPALTRCPRVRRPARQQDSSGAWGLGSRHTAS